MFKKKLHKRFVLLPMIFLLGYGFMMAYSKTLHDFSNAYFAAYFLWEGSFGTDIWDALSFNEQVVEAGFSEMFVAYYPNTPFLAFVFIPFAWIGEPLVAKMLFNILGSLLFLRALFRLKNALECPPILWALLPFIFFTSICNNLYFGQVYFLLFFLVVEGLFALEKNERMSAGMYWAIAILMKVFPIVLLVPLFLRKAYKSILGVLVFLLLFIACSLSFLDLSDWWYYLSEVFPKSNNGEYYDGFTPKAKSVTMLFKNLFIQDDLLNPSPFYASRTAYILVQTLYKTTIIATLVFFSLRNQKAWKEQIAFWSIGAMLLSPGWSSYASIMLLLPCLIIAEKASISIKHRGVFILLIALYCNIPMSYFWELSFLLLKFPKVYLLLSIFFYYNYLLKQADEEQQHIKLKISIFATLFFTFLLMGLMGNKMEKNRYVLEKEAHILIADYQIKAGCLEYKYWTIPQPLYQKTKIKITSASQEALEVRQHQIYYKNKQLTATKSNKRKPMLINGNEIIFLSDQNRGNGFYTLLKIPVE